MLTTAFIPISPPSEDMFGSTVNTRCVGSLTSIPNTFSLSWPSAAARGSGPSATHCDASLLEETLSGEPESCQFNKRKSTLCETELDFSSEHSQQDSHLHQEQKPQRKQSLLATVTAPESRRFETVILEVSDDEDTDARLGKRSPTSLHPTAPGLEPQPSRQTATSDHSFSLSCRFGHKSPVLEELPPGEEVWCQTCRTQLGALRQFALERGGSCLSRTLEPEIIFECGLHHQWTAPLKRATKNWCKECKAKKKVLLKEFLEQETAKADEERKQRQNKLLEESRQRLLANEKLQREAQGQELDNFKLILEEITRIASKYAREYCQKDPSSDFGQILLLYQTLILPEKSLATHLRSLPKEELKKEFRRYTILLHPDKNSHPKAKQAFQKAYALFTEHCN